MEKEFAEFMTGFEKYKTKQQKEYKDMREGQLLMLYISLKWPAQYAIMATDYTVDCFYRDDIMPATTECLKRNWQFKKD